MPASKPIHSTHKRGPIAWKPSTPEETAAIATLERAQAERTEAAERVETARIARLHTAAAMSFAKALPVGQIATICGVKAPVVSGWTANIHPNAVKHVRIGDDPAAQLGAVHATYAEALADENEAVSRRALAAWRALHLGIPPMRISQITTARKAGSPGMSPGTVLGFAVPMGNSADEEAVMSEKAALKRAKQLQAAGHQVWLELPPDGDGSELVLHARFDPDRPRV